MIADATLERVLTRRTVALLGDLIRGSLWGAVVLTWAMFAQVYARMYRLTLADPAHSDFTIFYFTARLLADGLPMYGASPARYGVHWAADHLGNLNPPHFQLLVQPLAWLSYGRAYAAWVGVNAVALGLSVIVIVRALAIELTWRRFAIGGAVIMSTAPFTTVAITSEWTFLLMLPATLAWAAARRGQWVRAGLWLGLCASLKLFFLLFVPWLILRRRWTALAGMGAAAATAVSVGVIAYGPFTYGQWLQSLGQVGWWWLPMNASWHGLVSRIFQGGSSVQPLIDLPAAVAPLGAAGAVVFSAVTISVARQLSAIPAHCDLAFLLLTSGALIASPLGWVYYMPLLLGPVIAVGCTGMWRLLSTRELAAIGAAGSGLYVSLEQASSGQPSALLSITLASIYFWSAFAVWLGAVALSKRVAG
jgi:hypothetical protein